MNAITVGQLINNNATDKDFKPLPNLDFKYGPYSSIAEALSNIPAELRAVGLTVGIRVNSTIQEFWFNGGVRDADLVVKNNGSGGGSGEAGKTPKFDKAIALALPADAAPTAEVVYKGEDESGTPLYDLEFGIPAGEAGTVPNWKTFVFKQSATQPDPPTGEDIIPAGWSDVPTVVGIWWMSVGEVRGATGKVTSWSTPIKCTGEAGKKGDTGPAGKDGVNGSNGIDGVPGISIEARYSLGSDTSPSAAFDSTIAKQRNPDGWSLTVPVPTQEKLYIWCIQTRISYNNNSDELGHLELDWSTPFKLTGTNGLPGSDGHNQIIYPQGIYDSTKSYVSDEYKAPYVYDPADGNFYVLNYEGPWKGTDQVYSTPSESYTNNQRYWIRFEGYEAIYTKIGIIANGLIGSAVFNGDYMFSQQGVDANGLKTTAYENFNPDNPGAPLNGKTFVPATLLDLKEGDAWFGHGNMNIDSQGNVAINGYIKERFDYFNGGVDEFSDIMIQSTRQVMIASDTDYTTKFAVGYSSGNIIMPTQFKLDLNVPVNIKFINLSSFMWNLVLDNRKSGLFSVNYWEEYGDMDQVYTFPKVFLHGGRVLDLIFLPTTTKTETIGSIVTTYYHGDWHVINTNEFVMKRGTAGDYSDYILESKNLEYK